MRREGIRKEHGISINIYIYYYNIYILYKIYNKTTIVVITGVTQVAMYFLNTKSKRALK